MNHKYWNYHTVCGGLGGFGEERILIIANEYCWIYFLGEGMNELYRVSLNNFN